jgi:hypothetical protein
MSWLVFFFGLVLSLVGALALAASIDLRGTELGPEYAISGAVALSSGIITLAIGALIRRIDAMAWRIAPPPREPAYAESSAPAYEAPSRESYSEPAPVAEADEEPINENRTGHLPSLNAIDHALQEPEAAPTLVGRYSAGGANYMIFSDGSIEAETEQGAFKFASMGDFKDYLAGKRH